jgi:hypothetical protein
MLGDVALRNVLWHGLMLNVLTNLPVFFWCHCVRRSQQSNIRTKQGFAVHFVIFSFLCGC